MFVCLFVCLFASWSYMSCWLLDSAWSFWFIFVGIIEDDLLTSRWRRLCHPLTAFPVPSNNPHWRPYRCQCCTIIIGVGKCSFITCSSSDEERSSSSSALSSSRAQWMSDTVEKKEMSHCPSFYFRHCSAYPVTCIKVCDGLCQFLWTEVFLISILSRRWLMFYAHSCAPGRLNGTSDPHG